ncbi:hypothetical protein GCM10028805_49460 [Spirosoma harenae]
MPSLAVMKTFIQFRPSKILFLTIGLITAGWKISTAQTTEPDQAPTTDKAIVSAIAPYRDDVRRSILLASQQPQVLTALAQQRASSEQAFGNLIQSFGQKKQAWFYDIARFPDVMHALATLPAGTSESAVNNLTKNMSADLQETAWKLYRHHHDDLVQVDNINQQADQAFDNLIGSLDVPTQNAFRQLIGMPDVLSQLTDQLDKTTRLGEAYRANPDQVTKELTALHDSLTVQNQQELAEYQNELTNDPQARQELQQAGQAYAQANGYNTGINPNPAWINTSYYYQNPYSFWFGYPYWYASPLWYPSAWWYGTGYYFGLGGNMVLFGMPSLGFSNWFFTRGRYAYPHLYNRFNNYYTHTMGEHRIWTPGNAGFMSAAHRTFGATSNLTMGRANWLTNSGQYARPNTWNNSARVAAPGRYQGSNANVYHSQAWGGASRSFGGGGFSGGFHGGGFHGGGGRR